MPSKVKIEKPSSLDVGWKLPFVKKFVRILMETCLCNEILELKNHFIPECVWDEVAKKMKVDKRILKEGWYLRLHLQLFSPTPIYNNDIRIKLIEYFHVNNVTDRRNINWDTVTSYFDGCTNLFLQRTFQLMCRRVKVKTNLSDLEDVVPYLYKEMIPYIIQHPEDKVLPRLTYDDGNLSHIDRDIEEFKK